MTHRSHTDLLNLIAQLRPYLEHTNECRTWAWNRPDKTLTRDDAQCSCGLAAALVQSLPSPPEDTK